MQFDKLVGALGSAPLGYVIAAAGCGKTELLIRAAEKCEGKPTLILTHTHAGVRSVLDRLARYNIGPRRVRVATIASFALRYVSSYPATSGIRLADRGAGTPIDYDQLCVGATALFNNRSIKRVVAASYSRVFVDEYQDCTPVQHGFILALAETLPTCVVGDPLQSVFRFRKEVGLNWSEDIASRFPSLGVLDLPRRWAKNPELGTWLQQCRQQLIAGLPLDFSAGLPVGVKWMEHDETLVRKMLYREARSDGTVAVLRTVPLRCHRLARTVGGLFTSMEEVECKDLMEFARRLDSNLDGFHRGTAIIDFVAACKTGVGTQLRQMRTTLKDGRLPKVVANSGTAEAAKSMAALVKAPTSASVLSAFIAICELSGDVYRRELLSDARKALRYQAQDSTTSFLDAAYKTREHLKITGRRVDRKTVSRTLLVKGLEFDHAVVMDVDDLDTENIYVALTRGSSRLTIVSRDPVVRCSSKQDLSILGGKRPASTDPRAVQQVLPL